MRTAARFIPGSVARLPNDGRLLLSVHGRAIAYGVEPPPLSPPHKGEGDADTAVSPKIAYADAPWCCREVPLPLAGMG